MSFGYFQEGGTTLKLQFLKRFVIFAASLVSEEGFYAGKIVVKSKNSQFKVRK